MERRLKESMYGERTLVCVCIYVSQSKRENHPFPQEAGWEIEWPYIHKGENHPVPRRGGVPPWPARWGEGMHKTAAMGEGMPQKERDILFHRAKPQEISCSTGGGGRGEYTMTSITFCIRVRNRIPWGGGTYIYSITATQSHKMAYHVMST